MPVSMNMCVFVCPGVCGIEWRLVQAFMAGSRVTRVSKSLLSVVTGGITVHSAMTDRVKFLHINRKRKAGTLQSQVSGLNPKACKRHGIDIRKKNPLCLGSTFRNFLNCPAA